MTPLNQLAINILPTTFCRELLRGMDHVYREAYDTVFQHPSLGEAQATYVLGYFRRAVAETHFESTAAANGLQPKTVQPVSGGCSHIYVQADRVGLTLCHVNVPGGFPHHSDTREQSAKLNEFAAQRDLFPVSAEAGQLYGVLVHAGAAEDRSAFRSLHLGFPDPGFTRWVEDPIDVREIVSRQQHPTDETNDGEPAPEPVWKETGRRRRDTGSA